MGKTSLAVRLAEVFGAKPLLEHPEENPFLERFYQSRKSFALPTQLFFLFQRARQIEQIKQSDMFSSGYVSDFLLDKDKLFARANLDDDELRLYEQVYAQMSLHLPVPDLVIYLQAPVDVLHERVRRRGVEYERLIDRDYLQTAGGRLYPVFSPLHGRAAAGGQRRADQHRRPRRRISRRCCRTSARSAAAAISSIPSPPACEAGHAHHAQGDEAPRREDHLPDRLRLQFRQPAR